MLEEGGRWVRGSNGGNEAGERRALLTVFWCTMGPAWVNKMGWQDREISDVRNWWGVGVDVCGDDQEEERVTLIDLRRNGLSGAIPPEIGDLKQLRYLYLGDNGLQGLIPKSISQLSNLQILSLRGNSLKGDVVPELGSLTALQTLSLRDNHLTNGIPPELGQLTGLKHLFLNNNKLTGPIPEELSNLEELEQLFLADNALEGPIPASFGRLVLLEELVLSGNGFTGHIPLELSNLADLTRLELDGNNLSGDVPPTLCVLANLKVLYLNNNNLTGPIPPDMGNLCYLERLDLSNNQLAGSLPLELGQLFNLELLILNNNRLTGPIPCELGRLHHITLLLLGGNQLSEAAPIVGGKGLRQWQELKRKAFLNSWSMIDRLAHLERENALLRKEVSKLRKSTSSWGKQHPAMRVEVSSAPTTVSTAVTTTPYGSASLASMEGIIRDGPSDYANRLSLSRVPSKPTRFGTSTLPVASGEKGTVMGRKGVEFTDSPAARTRLHEHSTRQAPGEQRPTILVRRASTGDDGHYCSDDLGGLYKTDRMATRSLLLTSAHRSSSTDIDMVAQSPAVAGSRGFVHSDSSSSEGFARGLGSGPGVERGVTTRRPVSGTHPPSLGKLGELRSFDLRGVGADAAGGGGVKGDSDSAALTSRIAMSVVSPLSSPVNGGVSAHSTMIDRSATAASPLTRADSGSGSGDEKNRLAVTRTPTERARSWASRIGLRPSFDMASDERNDGGGTSGVKIVKASHDVRGDDDGGKAGGDSEGGGAGGSSSYQSEGQDETSVPGALNGAMAQVMGLFTVGPIADFDDGDDEDDDTDEDADEEGCDKLQTDDTIDIPPPVSVVLRSDGTVRMDISLCSPE